MASTPALPTYLDLIEADFLKILASSQIRNVDPNRNSGGIVYYGSPKWGWVPSSPELETRRMELLGRVRGTAARVVHVSLHSMFRALKRERLIFRDPARTVALAVARHMPTPLPSDHLRGLLGKVPGSRDKLIVALAAVHALSMTQIRQLRMEDLDRARGQLRVRRPGRMDHVVYLDELTLNLVTALIIERSERWPDCTNPYLIVSRQTAVNDLHPLAGWEVIKTPFERAGVSAGKLRKDRIYDEARETADPVRLMRVFGICSATATRYVAAAHPDKKVDPIQA